MITKNKHDWRKHTHDENGENRYKQRISVGITNLRQSKGCDVIEKRLSALELSITEILRNILRKKERV